MSVHLEMITPANVDAAIGVRVRADQEHHVRPVAHSLAEAYAWGDVAWPRLIMDGDRPVGFLMAFLNIQWNVKADPTDYRSGLWRLNIDAAHQGRGYGRFAVEAVCTELQRRGRVQCFVTYEPGEDGPGGFYHGLGFAPTGETSGGQTVAVLDLA